jgi:hypothetical protein
VAFMLSQHFIAVRHLALAHGSRVIRALARSG